MMMIDPICNTSTTPSLDSILFSGLTSQNFDMSTIKPFLCEVMQLAGIENIDPILYSPEPIDFSKIFLNFAALTGIGDPRISLGAVLSAGFYEFFPLAMAQLEVIRAGGCQVVDGYICDSDGNKRKEMTIYCPPNFTIIPKTSEQIYRRTLEIVDQEISNHAIKFSNYIKTLITDGWTPTLHYYTRYIMFYIKITKGSGKMYFKYYPDARNKVAGYLNLPIIDRNDSLFDDSDHYNAMMVTSIPNY